jgi:uncharacterized protein (DUF427 family)
MWQYTGGQRPPFAIAPGAGQESVWDYPRPPTVVPDKRNIRVRAGETVIADTRAALRVLETAGPPTFYIPPHDVRIALLQPFLGASECEWKGIAKYWSLKSLPHPQHAIAWSYPTPHSRYEEIAGYYSFYPGRVQCFVDEQQVRPQPGFFYGGWITDEIVGPWKGTLGTEEW